MIPKECSYCRASLDYELMDGLHLVGKDPKIGTYCAMHMYVQDDIGTGDNKLQKDHRTICWPCWFKMTDWLAKQSGCVK